ncbi:hypothetical protein A3F66_07005 [candidate division TM6 bacterium RIFCSPHIGHO2_12_FULL_32_22]|nr:MAG: hypothetical protein A3F66_07005 [candidate division TM6 bacterium RIFCSPHIGHO2_12_FULL_32_22]
MSNYKNSDLLSFHEQFLSWDKSRSALMLLNRSKINEFYKNNSAKIETLYKKIEDIKRNYYVYQGDKIKLVENVAPVIGYKNKIYSFLNIKKEAIKIEKIPVLQEGKLEITMQQELAALLNTQIEIHI